MDYEDGSMAAASEAAVANAMDSGWYDARHRRWIVRAIAPTNGTPKASICSATRALCSVIATEMPFAGAHGTLFLFAVCARKCQIGIVELFVCVSCECHSATIVLIL